MEIKINNDLLEKQIRSEITEMRSAPWLESRMAIGKSGGVQIQLVFTKVKDDFCDNKIGSKIVIIK